VNNETLQKILDDGGYADITGFMHYEHLYRQVVESASLGMHFVELGAWKGRSTFFMAALIIASGKEIRLDVVDTFEGADVVGQADDEDKLAGRVREVFDANVEPVREHIGSVLHMRTDEACRLYQDDSLDFVMVDTDHSFEGANTDITCWWPKLKDGGIMAGDDYNLKTVRKAVHKHFLSVEVSMGAKDIVCWNVVKGEVEYSE